MHCLTLLLYIVEIFFEEGNQKVRKWLNRCLPCKQEHISSISSSCMKSQVWLHRPGTPAMWGTETGGSLRLAWCQPNRNGESQVQCPKRIRQRMTETPNVLLQPLGMHVHPHMCLYTTHAHTQILKNWDHVSLCIQDWFGTHYVEQSGLHSNSPTSASWVEIKIVHYHTQKKKFK